MPLRVTLGRLLSKSAYKVDFLWDKRILYKRAVSTVLGEIIQSAKGLFYLLQTRSIIELCRILKIVNCDL